MLEKIALKVVRNVRKQSALRQVQTPVRAVVTEERPVALTLISRSWLPGDGVALHTIRVAEVEPAPID